MSCRRSRLWDVFQDVAIWSSDYPHHDAEDPPALRDLADSGIGLRVDARRQESLEPAAGRMDDAERRVAGVRELRRGLDDSLEERVERELGGERDARLDEEAKAILLLGRLVGGRGQRVGVSVRDRAGADVRVERAMSCRLRAGPRRDSDRRSARWASWW